MKLSRYILLVTVPLFAVSVSLQYVTDVGALAEPMNSAPCTKRLISAHEGYKANADGDTIASQHGAFNIGANIADTDIWKTKDDHYVEIHDNDVSHSTDGHGLITQMTIAQVKMLRTTQHHEPIPEVKDSLALAQFKDPNRYLQFETKWSMNGHWALKAVDDQIKAAGMSKHVVIYSNTLDHLQYLSTIDSDLTLWYKHEVTAPPISDLKGLSGVMLAANLVTVSNVNMYHKAGYQVIRARIEEETKLAWQHFVHNGADGLMTDQPGLMVVRCRDIR